MQCYPLPGQLLRCNYKCIRHLRIFSSHSQSLHRRSPVQLPFEGKVVPLCSLRTATSNSEDPLNTVDSWNSSPRRRTWRVYLGTVGDGPYRAWCDTIRGVGAQPQIVPRLTRRLSSQTLIGPAVLSTTPNAECATRRVDFGNRTNRSNKSRPVARIRHRFVCVSHLGPAPRLS